jgi:hypothetical protein
VESLQHWQQQSGQLMHVISLLEKEFGNAPPKKDMLPMQPGGVPATYVNVADLMRDVRFRPVDDD